MKAAQQRKRARSEEPVRLLGRGLHARKGVRLPLRTLREAAGLTQAELAESTQMDQADISRLERRMDLDDCQLATLRRYIQALGGTLDLVARFDDKSILVCGSGKESAAERQAP